ncbi:YcjX family protein, partial [Methylobacterium sp. WL116]
MPIQSFAARAGSAVKAFAEASSDFLIQPTLRLGVTGLARSGKTVFTTALIHHLVESHALPAFAPAQEGRLRRARLVPQPDDDVPRFPFEEHFSALTESRLWPRSTDRISQFRLAIEYERAGGWRSGPGTLMLDVVDYPGEWLLDLALLEQSYTAWSRATIAGTRRAGRGGMAAPWLAMLRGL